MRRGVVWRAGGPALELIAYDGKSREEQRELLRALIHDHAAQTRRNAAESCTTRRTYPTDQGFYFPAYRTLSLPPTNGEHGEEPRAGMSDRGFLDSLRKGVLSPWIDAPARRVVVFGGKSPAYLDRQLAADDAHVFLVVDRSLRWLANAAARLLPRFPERVFFLRAEALFAGLRLLPRECGDVVVVPMPTPFWGEKNSHQRLLTSDFLCAAHRILREREAPADPRGVIAFTDCEPYADFMMEQLEEAKLLVPWARKDPAQTYARWLPHHENHPAREFPQQRFKEIIAIAASKSGKPSSQVMELIEGYDFRRKYYRSFSGESEE
ncbi:unnamed protein product [Phytomonas sp. Hart1]|nr:unnamed protein product [Phytomonas sp. Hart1]|eukprot:CCW69026.1 unnamed protein product [Phytomonas sp. isolate Hart1]